MTIVSRGHKVQDALDKLVDSAIDFDLFCEAIARAEEQGMTEAVDKLETYTDEMLLNSVITMQLSDLVEALGAKPTESQREQRIAEIFEMAKGDMLLEGTTKDPSMI